MLRARGPGLLFQNENIHIHDEGPVIKKMNDNISKTSQKKAGGSRKALQDLSNSGLVSQTHKLDIHNQGTVAKKTSDSTSKTSQKKVGGNRKALQDLSNSISIRQEAAGKNKNISKEYNVAEERCLHNSKQCAAARKAETDQNIYDAFLFEHGLLHPVTSPPPKETKASVSSPPKYLELESIPELPIPGKTDWGPSPIQLDSPAPLASVYELFELKKSVPRTRESELTFQAQNSVHHEGSAAIETINCVSNPSHKNVGVEVLGSRKALQDISNSSSLLQEPAAKKNLTEEVPNFVEESFLHDHNKCIAAQNAHIDHDVYNSLLFEHGLLHPEGSPEEKETVQVVWDSPPKYLELEEIPELPITAIADWCPSPTELDSPPFSPSWYELPELVLKAGIDD